MIDDIYNSDNETLRSLGFRFQLRVSNRVTYYLENSNLQVYVYINYDTKTYCAQIAKNFITEALIKPADTLDELINNIIEGNTQDYWWVDESGAKFSW